MTGRGKRMNFDMKRNGARALLLLSFFATGALFAENGIDVSATAESAAFAGIADDAGENGFTTELTLTLESAEDEPLSFRAEGGYTLSYASESAPAKAFDSGLAAKPDPAVLGSGTDLHREFFLNQAYAAASFDRALLRAGIVPVSWGSAYLWNPTSRTTRLTFPGENIDETAGKPGIDASLSIPLPDGAPLALSLEGYALASARIASPIPDVEELDAPSIPFGVKLQARTDAIDASVSFLRELVAEGMDPVLLFGADVALALGDLNCYAEATAEYDRSPKDASELSAGASWLIPRIEVTVRSEYIRIGEGTTDPDEYDAAAFLAGSKMLLARDYLYTGLEKEDPEASRWKLEGGVLANLDDASVAALAKASVFPTQDFELALFLRAFAASSGDDAEFGGKRAIGPGMSFTPYGSAAGLSAKWAF